MLAYKLWKNPDIRGCAQGCLAQYEERVKSLEDNATNKLENKKHGNSGIAMFTNFINRISGRK